LNQIYNPPAIAQYLTEDGSNAVQEVADPLKPSPLLQQINNDNAVPQLPQAQEQTPAEHIDNHHEGEMTGLIQPGDTQNAASSSFYQFLSNDNEESTPMSNDLNNESLNINTNQDLPVDESATNDVKNETLNVPQQPLQDINEALNISQPLENTNQDPPQNVESSNNGKVAEALVNGPQPPFEVVNEISNIPQTLGDVPNDNNNLNEENNLDGAEPTTKPETTNEEDQVQEV